MYRVIYGTFLHWFIPSYICIVSFKLFWKLKGRWFARGGGGESWEISHIVFKTLEVLYFFMLLNLITNQNQYMTLEILWTSIYLSHLLIYLSIYQSTHTHTHTQKHEYYSDNYSESHVRLSQVYIWNYRRQDDLLSEMFNISDILSQNT